MLAGRQQQVWVDLSVMSVLGFGTEQEVRKWQAQKTERYNRVEG